jgi:hypothetical protein
MKTELQNELFLKYPKLYVQRYRPHTETLMCFGFACGDGWHTILDNLSAQIQDRIDYLNAEGSHSYNKSRLSDDHVPVRLEACQVKEKYGTLRFYYDGDDSVVEGLVRMAEAMSATTCEICGDVGKLETKGWYKVRCEKHKGLPLSYT